MPFIAQLRSAVYVEGYFGDQLRFNQDQLEGNLKQLFTQRNMIYLLKEISFIYSKIHLL